MSIFTPKLAATVGVMTVAIILSFNTHMLFLFGFEMKLNETNGTNITNGIIETVCYSEIGYPSTYWMGLYDKVRITLGHTLYISFKLILI